MRLLVISHTPHYRSGGTVAGWGATVRELDHLASLFEEVVHVAPLHAEEPPASSAVYTAPNIRLRPVEEAGGRRLRDKLGIVARYPAYAHAILDEMRRADVVHVRAPANISLLAMLLLVFVRNPRVRWIKYAGSWRPYKGEPWNYAFQRWWLEHGWTRSQVTVNGSWMHQPAHIHTLLNPCLTEEEWQEARTKGTQKELKAPLRVMYAGRLSDVKGAFRAVEAVAGLNRRGVPAVLDMIGDGPSRHELEQLANMLGVSQCVEFRGWVPRSGMGTYYEQAHLLILPSRSEGWPKVISEAMANGVVPVASAVGSIPQYLQDFRVGRAVPYDDPEAFADAMAWYFEHPEAWKEESLRGIDESHRFSYDRYTHAVQALL